MAHRRTTSSGLRRFGRSGAALGAALLTVVLLDGCAESVETGADESHVPPSAIAATGRLTQLKQWKLPKSLREISGLAANTDGKVIAHDDEVGILYELDYCNGAIVAEWPMAEPPPRDDFEGVSLRDGVAYTITSTGTLYRTNLDTLETTTFDTGAGAQCEIEGLTHRDGQLVAICKKVFEGKKKHIRILGLGADHLVETVIDVAVDAKLRPSGIDWDEAGQRFLIVSAYPGAVTSVGADGRHQWTEPLDTDAHRQAEGIAKVAAQTCKDSHAGNMIVIADEGGKRKARLAIYRNDS